MDVAELVKIIAPLLSGAVGILVGIWHAGKKRGKDEATAESELMLRLQAQLEQTTAPFGETLKGLRQKINDVELGVERHFVSKDDFREFREEYRNDMRDIKTLVKNGHK